MFQHHGASDPTLLSGSQTLSVSNDGALTATVWPRPTFQSSCATPAADRFASRTLPFWTSHPSRVSRISLHLNKVIPLSFFLPFGMLLFFLFLFAHSGLWQWLVFFSDSGLSRAIVYHYSNFPLYLFVNLWFAGPLSNPEYLCEHHHRYFYFFTFSLSSSIFLNIYTHTYMQNNTHAKWKSFKISNQQANITAEFA